MKKNNLEEDEKYFKSLIERMNGFIETYPGDVDKYTAKKSRSTYSIIDMEYNSSTFANLLVQEDYIEDEEDAYALMRMICSETFRQFALPLLNKRVNERLTYINSLTKNNKITLDMVLGENLSQKYIEMEYIILGLTHENVSPLILFEDFVSFYNIRILIDKDTHSFSYHFTRDTPLKDPVQDSKWYTAKNFYEMCEHFNRVLLEKIAFSLFETIELDKNPVTVDLKEYIDMEYMSSRLTPQEIYDYLNSNEMARMALPLEYTYLLLNYKRFSILKDEATMDKIIKYLSEEDPNLDEKEGIVYSRLKQIVMKLAEEQQA